ncbi:MAG: dual specificity protein phosphatase [Chloroflexota bacterium]
MNFSRITEDIFVGTTPSLQDFERLHNLGVRLVINMRLWLGRPPAEGHPPLEYLRLRTFDSPLVPIPAEALIRGTHAALRVIGEGGRVYTHCSLGRHRSVAMAAAILIAQGLPAEAAMHLIKARRPEADPEAPHIRPRIVSFGQMWRCATQSARADAG